MLVATGALTEANARYMCSLSSLDISEADYMKWQRQWLRPEVATEAPTRLNLQAPAATFTTRPIGRLYTCLEISIK
jgi:hypothetical protein